MTKPRAAIERPDTRIAARVETLAFLFDVSVQTVVNAVNAGKLKASCEVFGVKLYHVKTVERAVFGLGAAEPADAEMGAEDPYMKGVTNSTAGKQRVLAS
jgi:hypothetical protein